MLLFFILQCKHNGQIVTVAAGTHEVARELNYLAAVLQCDQQMSHKGIVKAVLSFMPYWLFQPFFLMCTRETEFW